MVQMPSARSQWSTRKQKDKTLLTSTRRDKNSKSSMVLIKVKETISHMASRKEHTLENTSPMTSLIWEPRQIQMAVFTKENASMVRSTDMVSRYGQIPQDTKACGKTTRLMVWEYWYMRTVISMKACG